MSDFAAAARRAAHLASAALGWTPDVFWQTTPAELRTALGLDVDAQAVLDRSALERLMEAFPDE
jgi:uncharacterized phage protein (TIGR02216 family)